MRDFLNPHDAIGLLLAFAIIIVVIGLVWYYCTPRPDKGNLSADWQPPKPRE